MKDKDTFSYTKEDILKAVKGKVAHGTKQDAEKYMDALFEVIAEAMEKEERVVFYGFGLFKVVKRKAKLGRNPKTNEPVPIPERKSIVFKPGERLKAAQRKINK